MIYRILPFVLIFAFFSGCAPVTDKQDNGDELHSVCTDSMAVNFERGQGDSTNCVYVEKDQKSLLVYFTSTECPTCGKKGNPLFEEVIDQYGDSLVPMAVHYGFGDPMELVKSKELFNLFFPTHSPYFFINRHSVMNKNREVIATDTVKANLDSTINREINGKPVAGTAATFNIENERISIFYGVQFLRDTVGLYYLGVYLVEDGVENEQAGVEAEEISHHYVLRKFIIPPLGQAITTGAVRNNYIYRGKQTFELLEEWSSQNLHVVTVLWERTGNNVRDWKIVNASISGMMMQ